MLCAHYSWSATWRVAECCLEYSVLVLAFQPASGSFRLAVVAFPLADLAAEFVQTAVSGFVFAVQYG